MAAKASRRRGAKGIVAALGGALGCAFALAPTAAQAQELPASEPPAEAEAGYAPAPIPPPPPEDPGPPPARPRRPQRDGARGFLELRGGLGTYADRADGFGANFGVAGGLAFGWVDLGIALNHVSLPHEGRDSTSVIGVGPELATRTWLGGPATLRLAVDPQYRVMRDGGASTGTIGADLLAQFLFTLTEETVPAWRVGVGVRGGRFWELGSGDRPAYWTAGLDVVVRSWW